MQLKVIQQKIFEIRGHKVMLDMDLAELYETETKRLKEAVRRNIDRFPDDFMFELTQEEYNSLRSQFASLENIGLRGKHSKYLPFAFTEQGVAMLSSVLKSPKAIEVNIAIMRTFVVMRQYALTYNELAQKIAELESKTDTKFANVYEALNYLVTDKKKQVAWEKRKRIGYKK